MKNTQFKMIAIEDKTRNELRSIAKKEGKLIYAIVADAIKAYKKNLT